MVFGIQKGKARTGLPLLFIDRYAGRLLPAGRSFAFGGVHHHRLGGGQLQVVAQAQGRQLLAQQLHGQAVLFGKLGLLGVHIGLGNVDSLAAGDLGHGQLIARRRGGLLAGVVAQLLHGGVPHLQILLQGHALGL